MSLITCPVCHHHCRLAEGQTGFCRARQNQKGESVCLNYGRLTSLALDPIEKKPLARFYPGSKILSLGSYGCNLHCPFCQNHEISMAGPQTYTYQYVAPETLAAKAVELQKAGNIGIAYTYNEPLISYEYLVDTGKLLHQAGLKNVVVTNGCACLPVARALNGIVDAYNIDLKGYTEAYYQSLGGDLTTVKAFIKEAVTYAHVELTTLVVPGANDTDAEMEASARWISSLSPEIPLHVSRFFPRFELLDKPPTPVATIYHLAEVARRHLRYVYTGNC